jgi:hypothetical protein
MPSWLAGTHISGYFLSMKTTLEIPEAVIRRAKARAAATGQTLTRLVTEALNEKLAQGATRRDRPWMKFAGALRGQRAESRRILERISAEFEAIEPEAGG